MEMAEACLLRALNPAPSGLRSADAVDADAEEVEEEACPPAGAASRQRRPLVISAIEWRHQPHQLHQQPQQQQQHQHQHQHQHQQHHQAAASSGVGQGAGQYGTWGGGGGGGGSGNGSGDEEQEAEAEAEAEEEAARELEELEEKHEEERGELEREQEEKHEEQHEELEMEQELKQEEEKEELKERQEEDAARELEELEEKQKEEREEVEERLGQRQSELGMWYVSPRLRDTGQRTFPPPPSPSPRPFRPRHTQPRGSIRPVTSALCVPTDEAAIERCPRSRRSTAQFERRSVHIELFKLSAAQGHAGATADLRTCHLNGFGVDSSSWPWREKEDWTGGAARGGGGGGDGGGPRKKGTKSEGQGAARVGRLKQRRVNPGRRVVS